MRKYARSLFHFVFADASLADLSEDMKTKTFELDPSAIELDKIIGKVYTCV